MKKTTQKLISAFLAVLLVFAMTVTAFAAEDDSITVTLRIEGPDNCILYNNYEITADSTAADLILYADELDDTLTVSGADEGYIYEVNGIYGGTFGGWDGWYYCVNGKAPDFAVTDYTLSDGDSVVLYYGAYPCLIPEIDTTNLSSNGVITFTALQTDYDENWNPIYSTVPVADMTVIFDNSIYTTDENGEITVSEEERTIGLHYVQISKTDESGAPAVLRFAEDFTVEIAQYGKGDVNLDGIIDITDVTYIQLYLASSISLNDTQLENANVDGADILDINDATYLQRAIAGYTDAVL